MKFTLLLIIVTVLVGIQPKQVTAQASIKKTQDITDKKSMDDQELRHVVLIKFNDEATEDDISEVEQAFSALPDKIPEIEDYEWGLNNSPEGLNKGYTHCFLVTFKSEEDRAAYLPHPAHKEFVSVLEPHMADVLVIDYWANEH